MKRVIAALVVLLPAGAVAQEWLDFRSAFVPFPCPDGWAGCVVDGARVGAQSDALPADLRIDWFTLEPTPVFSPFVGLSAYTGERLVLPAEPSPAPPPPAPVEEPEVPAPEPGPAAATKVAPPPAPKRVVARRKPKPEPAPPVPPPPEGCADLIQLEGTAMLGQLAEEQVQCLEQRVAEDPRQTDRKHASYVLMADAWGRQSLDRWESLVLRHLAEIDRSDPALCYKLALHLEQKGPPRAAEVIRWSELAMENARRDWRDDQYVDRMYALHRLRSKAASELWYVTEQRHAGNPTPDTRDAVDEYRGQAKNYAKEWYLYARRVGKDTTHPKEMCLSAAGTSEFCEAS